MKRHVGGPVLLVEMVSARCRLLEPDLAETSVGNIQDNPNLTMYAP